MVGVVSYVGSLEIHSVLMIILVISCFISNYILNDVADGSDFSSLSHMFKLKVYISVRVLEYIV